MIYINDFSIADDGLSINVEVETAAGSTISSAKFWTDATFKNYSNAIDLTSLLSGVSNTESFTIGITDVNVSNFYNGIFFVEFEGDGVDDDPSSIPSGCNDCNNQLAVAAKLIAAKQCLLNKVLALDICASCNDGCSCIKSCDIITLDNYIDAMVIAMEYGLYLEAITLLNSIRKLCSTCSDCMDIANISANTGLNYYTINNEIILG